jgi:hypothetical protein
MVMIAVCYIGDVRVNQVIIQKNHKKFLDRLSTILPVNIYRFTRTDPERGICPYDEVQAIDDTIYRRGLGGAVQVWDFMRSVDCTKESIVMKLRTDLWFTDTSIDVICNEVKEILQGNTDIAYFGSDWSPENCGTINNKIEVLLNNTPVVEDLIVLAKRDKLRSFNDVISHINKTSISSQRSGNKSFKLIIPHLEKEGVVVEQYSKSYRILCQLWVMRDVFYTMPTDLEVCKGYILSYITGWKLKRKKKQFADPNPMQSAVDWWRQQMGWPAKKINLSEPIAWQTQ